MVKTSWPQLLKDYIIQRIVDALGIVDNNQNFYIMSTNNNGKATKFNPIYGLVIIGVLFFAIILSASIMGVFKGYEPYQQLIAAMLSVAATGVITALLLYFQRRQQEQLNQEQREFQEIQTLDQRRFEAEQKEKEKDRLLETKVFEEKLRIYQEFLKKLCDVVKDQKITPEEEIELQFQVSYIAMHTKSDSIKIISEQVRKIVVDIKNNEKDSNNMLSQLFVISDTLYKELYDKDNSFEEEDRSKTIVNFESILAPKNDSRLYELMQNIVAKGSNKRIDRDGILIYEYWCNNKNNRYIKANGTISIGISCNNKQFSFSIMTNGNHPEKFQAMVQGVCDETKLFMKDTNTNFVADVGTDDSKIIDFFNLLLSKMKEYRETDLPE